MKIDRPWVWTCKSGDCGWCYSTRVGPEGECIGEKACRKKYPIGWAIIDDARRKMEQES